MSGACDIKLSSRAALLTITSAFTHHLPTRVSTGVVLVMFIENIYPTLVICLITSGRSSHNPSLIILWISNGNWKEMIFWMKVKFLSPFGYHALHTVSSIMRIETWDSRRLMDGGIVNIFFNFDFFISPRRRLAPTIISNYSILKLELFSMSFLQLVDGCIVNTNHFLSSGLFALISIQIISQERFV